MTREEVMAAVRAIPPENDFVWDGVDEDDRPWTDEEFTAAVEVDRKKRGRPLGSGTKEPTTIRVDIDVLAALKASGPGWQTRVNDLLRAAMALQQPK